ncbi:MAG: DUF6599 family protein [Terriglobia bacterium]
MLSLSAALLALIVCLFGALPLPAAQKSVIIPLISVSTWRLQASVSVPLDALASYGDNAAIDQELGVQSGVRRTYRRGTVHADAIFEKAADPSSAYSLYTLYHSPGMKSESGVELAMVSSQQAVMTRGRYFIRVLRPSNSGISAEAFRSLLIAIGGAQISQENAQSLPAGLPAQGLVPGSEKYLLGVAAAQSVLPSLPVDLIGFTKGAEAEVGTYTNGNARLRLLEINYPTPQLAQVVFKKLAPAVQLNQARGTESVFGRLQGSYALLVLNADSANAATHLLDQFKVAESLTWSPKYKKESTAYDLVMLLMANGELVLIIIGLAIPCGILIYLARRFIAKHFPHSAFSRVNGEDLIRLNLG